MSEQGLRTVGSATLAVLALGALVTLALMLGTADLPAFLWSGLFFLLWALAPYVLLAFGLPRVSGAGSRIPGLVGSLVVVSPALALYIDALFVHADAQSALVFVTLPFLQLLGAVLVIAVVRWIEARRRRAGSRGG